MNADPNLPPTLRLQLCRPEMDGVGLRAYDATPCTLLGDHRRARTTSICRTSSRPSPTSTAMVCRIGRGRTTRAIGSIRTIRTTQRSWEYVAGLAGGAERDRQAGRVRSADAVRQERSESGRRDRPRRRRTRRADERSDEDLAASTTTANGAPSVPDSVHMPSDAFGPDGRLPRVRRLQRRRHGGPVAADALRSERGRVSWWVRSSGTPGKGFYADSHVHDACQSTCIRTSRRTSPTRFADPGIHVTDVNNDGRMDVVIFNNDHTDANQQPAPQIVFLLSNGDGTFVELDLPMGKAGTRDDVKYWVDNTLRPIKFYPDRLENDEAIARAGRDRQLIPGAQVAAAGRADRDVPRPPAATPRRRVSPPAGTSQRSPTRTATARSTSSATSAATIPPAGSKCCSRRRSGAMS